MPKSLLVAAVQLYHSESYTLTQTHSHTHASNNIHAHTQNEMDTRTLSQRGPRNGQPKSHIPIDHYQRQQRHKRTTITHSPNLNLAERLSIIDLLACLIFLLFCPQKIVLIFSHRTGHRPRLRNLLLYFL